MPVKTVRVDMYNGYEITHRPKYKGLWYHLTGKGMGPRVRWFKTAAGMRAAWSKWEHAQIKRDKPKGYKKGEDY
jgi:hypothetical protein